MEGVAWTFSRPAAPSHFGGYWNERSASDRRPDRLPLRSAAPSRGREIPRQVRRAGGGLRSHHRRRELSSVRGLGLHGLPGARRVPPCHPYLARVPGADARRLRLQLQRRQIGRASCRERWEMWGGGGLVKTKKW